MRRLRMTIPAAVLAAALWLAPSPAAAEDGPVPQISLFPVRIEHGFPRPEATFDEVRRLILDHYYAEEIDSATLYWAAIEGMLRRISPPSQPDLSRLWTADEYLAIRESLQGEQVSIGIKSRFNPGEGSLTVTEVLPDGPAESILRPMDRILRIDGEPLKGLRLERVDTLLRRAEGERITLTVNRDIRVFDVTVACQKFEQKNLTVADLAPGIAVVALRRMTAGLSGRLRETLAVLAARGMQAVVLDLRDNPGGVFVEALRVVELFLPARHILLRTFRRDGGVQNYVSSNDEPFSFELAVLINGRTASSAEIVAGCLQDHDKALLVGSHTYGKAIFEQTFPLANEMHVKFITGAMYTPKGRSWQNEGIRPDFLVAQDEKTLAALRKLPPAERFRKDVAVITAYKLLARIAR